MHETREPRQETIMNIRNVCVLFCKIFLHVKRYMASMMILILCNTGVGASIPVLKMRHDYTVDFRL